MPCLEEFHFGRTARSPPAMQTVSITSLTLFIPIKMKWPGI